MCCNFSLGLATKARDCKGEGPEGSSGVMSHVSGNVEECDGMNPTLPNKSFDGLPNFQTTIAGVKTHWIETFLISLESS
jgi:hypothetical protein